MILIFYKTFAVFFCDAKMYIYDNSTKFLNITGSYRPLYDINFSVKERVTWLSGQLNGDTQLHTLSRVFTSH